MTQIELAERPGNTQAFVSKCEQGERRINAVDLMEFRRGAGRAASGAAGRVPQSARSRGIIEDAQGSEAAEVTLPVLPSCFQQPTKDEGRDDARPKYMMRMAPEVGLEPTTP